MLSNKCPIIGKTGLTRTIVEFIQRSFVLVNFISKKRGTIEQPKTPKRSISNAGYHLSLKQVLRLIDACSNKRDHVLIQTLAFTGMRRAEVTALTAKDILWDSSLLLIRHGKGDKQRLVPIPLELLENLKGLLSDRMFGAIFQSNRGRQLSMRQVNRIITKAGINAGIDNPNPNYANITCHLLRHTFARLWKDKQGSMETLSSILGHSSQATTMDLYGKESLEDIKHNYNQIIKQMLDEHRRK